MAKYKIPLVWTMLGDIEIEASNIDDAIQLALDGPLPENGEYLSDSVEVDENTDIEIFDEELNEWQVDDIEIFNEEE